MSTIPKNYNVTCPMLMCDQAYFAEQANTNQCFEMKTDAAANPIYARDCYDKEAKKSKDAKPHFCEFDLLDH